MRDKIAVGIAIGLLRTMSLLALIALIELNPDSDPSSVPLMWLSITILAGSIIGAEIVSQIDIGHE